MNKYHAAFRTQVEDRAARLRQLSLAEIKQIANEPVEHVTIGSRKGTIAVIALILPSGGLQVVVQGFLKHRFMPGSSVALDGFYKYPDETVAAMTPEEFWDFT